MQRPRWDALMANLEDYKAHNAEQKGLKAMIKLAEMKR